MLEKRFKVLEDFIKRYALPGFGEAAKDSYTEDYRVVFDEMSYLADEMRRSIRRGDEGHFSICEQHYLKEFNKINTNLAKTRFADLIDELLDQDMAKEEAERRALEICWADQRLQYWLPAQAVLKSPQGHEVFLVANKRHIPRGSHYVLHSEVKVIMESGRDPWEYVLTRTA